MITLDEALTKGRGVERPFNCPNPEHEDRNASASVNINNGLWYCFACAAKGSVEGYVPDPKQVQKMLVELTAPERLYAESWLDLFDRYRPSPYWVSRFGEATARKYRCGTDPETGHPTYPIRNRYGKPIGVVKRTDGDPKYSYPYGVRTSQTMFASKSVARTEVLILVEGAADVMALDEGGLPSTWRACGTYGAGLHAAQREIITNMHPACIVTAFDGDKAGQRAAEVAAAQCGSIAVVLSHHWDKFGVKDPGELDAAARIPALELTVNTAYRRKRASGKA